MGSLERFFRSNYRRFAFLFFNNARYSHLSNKCFVPESLFSPDLSTSSKVLTFDSSGSTMWPSVLSITSFFSSPPTPILGCHLLSLPHFVSFGWTSCCFLNKGVTFLDMGKSTRLQTGVLQKWNAGPLNTKYKCVLLQSFMTHWFCDVWFKIGVVSTVNGNAMSQMSQLLKQFHKISISWFDAHARMAAAAPIRTNQFYPLCFAIKCNFSSNWICTQGWKSEVWRVSVAEMQMRYKPLRYNFFLYHTHFTQSHLEYGPVLSWPWKRKVVENEWIIPITKTTTRIILYSLQSTIFAKSCFSTLAPPLQAQHTSINLTVKQQGKNLNPFDSLSSLFAKCFHSFHTSRHTHTHTNGVHSSLTIVSFHSLVLSYLARKAPKRDLVNIKHVLYFPLKSNSITQRACIDPNIEMDVQEK